MYSRMDAGIEIWPRSVTLVTIVFMSYIIHHVVYHVKRASNMKVRSRQKHDMADVRGGRGGDTFGIIWGMNKKIAIGGVVAAAAVGALVLFSKRGGNEGEPQ